MVALAIGFLTVFFASEVVVDEANINLRFNDDGRTVVVLPVFNDTHEDLPVSVTVDFIEPGGDVYATTSTRTTTRPGVNVVTVEVEPSLIALDPAEAARLPLYRLRYHVAALSDASTSEPATGIVSVSEIFDEFFETRVLYSYRIRSGRGLRVTVLTQHATSASGVRDVEIVGSLSVNDEEIARAAAVTDERGLAILELLLPDQIIGEEASLSVHALKGPARADIVEEIFIYRAQELLMTTDKKLYQPGQTLHLRFLAFDASQRAIRGADAKIRVTDPEGQLIFADEIVTSEFGVGSADWEIPEGARLGDYDVEASLDEEVWSFGASASQSFRLSRYDIPEFSVEATPDRVFYLPGQKASVTVRASYLFGEPVQQASVRIVHPETQRWNVRLRKWETEQREAITGEFNEDGVFVAEIDLAEAHGELTESRYGRARDIELSAYVTDDSTGRTEPRRFRVRVSKEPLHVYLIERNDPVRGTPYDFYVSTFTADGTAVESDVSIGLGSVGSTVATVRTNRYGVARVEGIALPSHVERDERTILLGARDEMGREGHWTEYYYVHEGETVDLHMDKTLHRAGEPIEARVATSPTRRRLFVEVAKENEILHSRIVELNGGRASFVIPYEPSFVGALGVVATPIEGYSDRSSLGSHPVIYPEDTELSVTATPDEESYEPGDEARVVFDVRGPNGEIVESALGVVVVDEALLERQRTDKDYGDSLGFHYLREWRGHDRSLGDVSRRDIEKLDPAVDFTEELDLVAEILFRARHYPSVAGSKKLWESLREDFSTTFERDQAPLRDALNALYTDGHYPESYEALKTDLATTGIELEALLDPWGNPYLPSLESRGELVHFELHSESLDERPETIDDFIGFEASWKYFERPGRAVDHAAQRFHERAGGFVRSKDVLRRELARDGVDLDALRDPWGRAYRVEFGVSGEFYTIDVFSGEVSSGEVSSNATRVWQSRIDYFTEIRARIHEVLIERLHRTGSWPTSEIAMQELLTREGILLLRDPWGRPYYVTAETRVLYANRTLTQAANGVQRTEVQPVTRTLGVLSIRSGGPEDPEHPAELELARKDVTVAEFRRLLSEQQTASRHQILVEAVPVRGFGAIRGRVTDSDGVVLPGATVHLSGSEGFVRTTVTSETGDYHLENLPAGRYKVTAELAGFISYAVEGIDVSPSERSVVNLALSVGGIAESVTVTGTHLIETANASISSTTAALGRSQPMATPRLRQFFPETLVWEPELITDVDGQKEIRFTLADNITTWNVAALASTRDGYIGTVETELLATRPFFIVHDPPKVLTTGDRLDLPVVLRNLLDQPLELEVELESEPWFTTTESTHHESVAATSVARSSFDLEITRPDDNAKLRVSAIAAETGDAVEKRLDVRPDGAELVRTTTELLSETSTTWPLEFPDEAIRGSQRARVTIYPNLMAHALESVDGILRRPYGCTEQAISAAYPAVLLLKYQAKHGVELPSLTKAQRYMRLTYQRLEQNQHPDGGFAYWGGGAQPDVALTAYALRFLKDVEPFLETDRERSAKAKNWLISQQHEDGYWPVQRRDGAISDRSSAMATLLVASVIASENGTAARRALEYVDERIDELGEPYLLASLALLARELGDSARAEEAEKRLRTLAHDEGNTSYWHLQTNTPFYGWGLAGRIETTALAIRALSHRADSRDLVDRGLLFLLRNKDRYGVWYSTQATVRSVEAILDILPQRAASGGASSVDVLVNGAIAKSVALPEATQIRGPIEIDISEFLRSTSNEITLQSSSVSGAAAAVTSTYFRPWMATEPGSDSLALSVRYDAMSTGVGEPVDVYVDAKRVGFRGYGMLLAEVGLPPGADVDRASLESVTNGWKHGVYRYDVLPDRIVFYLWPRAGGSEFSFRFTPRFTMRAKTQPSVLFDYYNPEARVVVPPVVLEVQ